MKKEYFEPADLRDKVSKEEEDTDLLTIDIREPLNKFNAEFRRMEMGQSKYRKGGIYLPKGTAPFKAAEEQLRMNPTNANLANFINMVSQDLGAQMAAYTRSLFPMEDDDGSESEE